MLVENTCIFGGHSFLMKRGCGRQGKRKIRYGGDKKGGGAYGSGGDKRSGGLRSLQWVTWKDLSYEHALPNFTTEHA